MFAQLPQTSKVKTLGAVSPGKIMPINNSLTDTLGSNDTIFYKQLVNHDQVCFPYLSLLQKHVAGADTAVVTITLWQSVDGVHNWKQVKATTSPSAYSFTFSKALQLTGSEIDGWSAVIWFRSQYIGIRLVSATISSYKAIYYGSIRYDNN
jgi:hypothetical protein